METKTKTFPRPILSLVNFWPAALVVLLVALSLPGTAPILKEIPAKLTMPVIEPSAPKPALPDPVEEPEPEPLADSGNTYTDGVYKGSSRGYGGTITVQVTVAEKKISQVSILSAPGETGEFLSKAKGVIDRVIQAQTWQVDVVSGATYSSRGILGAIQNALTGETVENEKPPAQPKPAAPLTQQPFDDTAAWKDGTYIGTATGFGGTIKVEVTIKGGRIDAIRILEHGGETDSYFNKAKKVVSRILKAGTPNVDTVSGATYSSNGIINAVKNALKKAAGAAASEPGGDDPADTPAKTPARDDTGEPDLKYGLKDGTYTVDVDCTDGRIFDYTIRLTMVVKDGKIRSITAKRTDDRSDDPDRNETYLGYAVNGRMVDGKTYQSVIRQIIAKQTTSGVDTVSGATWSSQAILRGVKKLLAQAANDKSQAGEDEEDAETGKKTGEEEQKPGGNSGDGNEPGGEEDPQEEPDLQNGLEDGTYTMEAVCTDDPDDPLFDYNVLVTMVVKDGTITSLTAKIAEDRSEDPESNQTYFGYAIAGRTRKNIEYRSVIAQILEKQSAKDIDTVSGATYSSRTIINTVKALLRQAAKAPAGEEEDSGRGRTDDPGSQDDPGSGDDPGQQTDDPGGQTDDPDSGDDSGTGDSGETAGSGDSSGTGTSGDSAGTGDDSGTGTSGENAGTGDSAGTGKSEEESAGTGSSQEDGGTGTSGVSTGAGDDSGTGKSEEESAGTGSSQEDGGTGTSGDSAGTGGSSGTGQDDQQEPEKESPYKDGTYTAKAHCIDDPDDPFFDYTIKVTVRVEDGEITKITTERTDDESEDPDENESYMNYARNGRTRKGKTYPGIPDQVLDSQSASGLDAVTGATYSSRAMIKALQEAVEKARK